VSVHAYVLMTNHVHFLGKNRVREEFLLIFETGKVTPDN
jgi:hypothetical protein